MTEAYGLVKRDGEKNAVNGLAFTARPGIVTGLLSPNTTAAHGPSWGIPPRLAGDTRASSGSGRRRRWRRLAAGLLVVADGLVGDGRRLRGQQAGGQPRMTVGRTDRRATVRQRQLRDQGDGASTSQDTRAAAGPSLDVEGKGRHRQWSMVLALLAGVIVLDQAAKWWAWRHVSGAEINTGGDSLVGRTVGRWYADPVTGALLDLLDFGLLSIAVSVLVRRRRPAAVVVPGALMFGGWGSNLLDRLGMHYWTAPGSVRGAVDFIHIGGHYYNLADFFIIGATPLFLLAVGYLGRQAANRPATAGAVTSAARNRPRARVPALVGAGVIVVVALGAAHYGGVVTAPAPVSATGDRQARTIVAAYRSGAFGRDGASTGTAQAQGSLGALVSPGQWPAADHHGDPLAAIRHRRGRSPAVLAA
jgi:lipoprotein signal peptidase